MRAGVRADVSGAHPLADDPFIAPSRVVGGDVMHTRAAASPFLVQRVGHELLTRLVPTAVTDQRHINKSMLPQTPGGMFEHFDEDVLR